MALIKWNGKKHFKRWTRLYERGIKKGVCEENPFGDLQKGGKGA